ncbi:helix-turn-helix domain-containing protein [Nocardia colli]|uniref:helix-turn-helix domain-containing protein n=1 Tax=Nocardia colli TaxID=2545717 RepID=UPI0035D6733A
MIGRYLKQWEPNWLNKVIAKIEASPTHRSAKTVTNIRPRRLDRRLSSDIVAELVKAYRDGISTIQLCEQHQLSKGGLLKILREQGVKMRKQPLSEAQIKQAARLYAEGQSLRAVATELGSSFSTVREALLAQGVEMRPSTR